MNIEENRVKIIKKLVKYSFLSFLIIFVLVISSVLFGIKIEKKRAEDIILKKIPTQVDIVNDKIYEVLNQLHNYYVFDLNVNEICDLMINKTLQELDSNNSYLNSKFVKNQIKEVKLDFYYQMEDGLVRIIAPIYERSLYDFGIRSGDVILKINDEDLKLKKYNELEIYSKFVSNIGKKMSLVIKSKNEDSIKELNVILNKFENSDIIFCMLNSDIGYIKIPFFYKNIAKEFNSGINFLLKNGMKNLVLDVRSNPGGDFDEMISILERFIPKGLLLCSIKGKEDKDNNFIYSRSKECLENINLYLMIDEGTASCSEVFASAIQENEKGILIGTNKSFGRGVIRNTFFLKDGSKILMSVGKYYTPSGKSIHREKNIKETIEKNSQEMNFNFFEKNTFYKKIDNEYEDQGGINPDYFFNINLQFFSNYVDSINFLIKNVAKNYTTQDVNLSKMSFEDFMTNFEVPNILLESIKLSSKEMKIDYNENVFRSIKHILKKKIKLYIASYIWPDQPYFKDFLLEDILIQKTIEFIKKKEELKN
jgi:carboxyl-terminal processing protease